MKENYQNCLDIILHHEGGYVNHPEDPGGMTNLVVTKRVYEDCVGYAVSEHTMQNLTKEDVAPIYKKNYWDKVKADDLPNGVDFSIFDLEVKTVLSSLFFCKTLIELLISGLLFLLRA